MNKTLFLILLIASISAYAQKTTIEDINKSMVTFKTGINTDSIVYAGVSKPLIEKIKNENGYGGQYDIKGLALSSTLSNIQAQIKTLSFGKYLTSEWIDVNEGHFKYAKESQLTSLKNDIDKLQKDYPDLNVDGYKKAYDFFKVKLEEKKVEDQKKRS